MMKNFMTLVGLAGISAAAEIQWLNNKNKYGNLYPGNFEADRLPRKKVSNFGFGQNTYINNDPWGI